MSSTTFRDTLTIAAISATCVAGLVAWSVIDDGPVTASPTTGSPTAPGQPATSGQPATAGATPAVATPTGGGSGGGSTGAGSVSDDPTAEALLELPDDPAKYETEVEARDDFIASLSAPAGGAEQPSDRPGQRGWLFEDANWEAHRDAFVAQVSAQGMSMVKYSSIHEGDQVGELYVLTDPTGAIHVQLATGTYQGQSVIEVSRR